MIIVRSDIVKTLFSKIIFLVRNKTQLTFSNSFGLKSVFEKFSFRDGLVWTVGLTVQIEPRFQISLTQRGWGLRQMPDAYTICPP